VVLVKITQGVKRRFRIEVIPCAFWQPLSHHEVNRVTVDGADIEIGEWDTIYVDASTVKILGETAEIRTVAYPQAKP